MIRIVLMLYRNQLKKIMIYCKYNYSHENWKQKNYKIKFKILNKNAKINKN